MLLYDYTPEVYIADIVYNPELFFNVISFVTIYEVKVLIYYSEGVFVGFLPSLPEFLMLKLVRLWSPVFIKFLAELVDIRYC